MFSSNIFHHTRLLMSRNDTLVVIDTNYKVKSSRRTITVPIFDVFHLNTV
jgi:hypothetical protein